MINRSHYVYVYEVAGIIRYVGSGKGKRIEAHLKEVKKRRRARLAGAVIAAHRWYDKLKAAILAGELVRSWQIVEGLTVDEARDLEFRKIAEFEADQLWNSVTSFHPYISHEEAAERHRAATTEANRKTVLDPNWQAKHSTAMRVVVLEAEWQSNHRAAMRAIVQTPEWRAKHRAGIEARRKLKREQRETIVNPGLPL
jgi:hypothetical protein